MYRFTRAPLLIAAVAVAAALGTAAAAAATNDSPAAAAPAAKAPTLLAFAANSTSTTSANFMNVKNHGGRGARIIVSPANPRSLPSNDIWVVKPNGNGSFTLRAFYNRALCLNVPASRHRSGTALDVWTCTGRANQKFLITASPYAPQYAALRPYPAASFCLAVSHGIAAGHPVIELGCNSAKYENWAVGVVKVSGGAAKSAPVPRL
jgi:Ricin-type beta-trefoil lectin domain-like